MSDQSTSEQIREDNWQRMIDQYGSFENFLKAHTSIVKYKEDYHVIEYGEDGFKLGDEDAAVEWWVKCADSTHEERVENA